MVSVALKPVVQLVAACGQPTVFVVGGIAIEVTCVETGDQAGDPVEIPPPIEEPELSGPIRTLLAIDGRAVKVVTLNVEDLVSRYDGLEIHTEVVDMRDEPERA